ncbi:MAG: TraR/DksA C4-type zinc finger protein [Thermodesulfobacteriota bacterium]|nr:TraR/DksA C4-type zinc finger protein [Thermodesulfobacteriota bacterium]
MVDELTDMQQNGLHQDLLTLRRELQKLLAQSAEQSKPVDLDKPIGRLSRMDEMQQQSMAQASRHATQQRLVQIGAAIGRIDRDEYGLCVACEEDIGFGRLKVRPEAPLCLACQSARENGR